MTGKELYELFRQTSEQYGCLTDEWEELDELQKIIWTHMAFLLLNLKMT